jgi:PAS domain S-box-containing protein
LSEKNNSEESFTALSNLIAEPVIIINGKGAVLAANTFIKENTGFSDDEIVGKNFLQLDLIDQENKAILAKNFEKRMKGIEIEPYEIKIIAKNGEAKHFEVKGKRINYAGEVVDLVVFHDVTQRRHIQHQLQISLDDKCNDLRESEESFRALINSMDDLVFVFGMDGTFKSYHQPSRKNGLYVQQEQFIGKHFRDVLPPHVSELCQTAMQRLNDSGKPQEFDYYLDMNGERSWFNAKLSPVTDQSARPTSIISVVRNITDRKKAEEALKASEIKHRRLFEEAIDAILVADAETGTIVDCNPAALRMFGKEKSELVGHHQSSVHPKELMTGDFTKGFREHVHDPTIILETKIITKMGEIRDVTIRPSLFELEGKRFIQGTFRDITEHKRSQEALMMAEEKFRLIFEGAGDGILAADVKTWRFAFANPKICEITGYSLEELLKLSVDDLHPKKDLPNVIDQFTNQLLGKTTLAMDIPVLRKDERVVYCDINSKPMRIVERTIWWASLETPQNASLWRKQ